MLNNIFNKNLTLILNLLFTSILLIFINGRSILGLYIFGFRLAELMTGFSLFIVFIIIFNNQYFSKNFNTKTLISFYVLIAYFIFLVFKSSASFVDLYVYKSSIFIWYISFLFFGYLVFKNVVITEKFIYFGYFGLFIVFIFNIIYYPDFIETFFNQYSDKTRYLKGSEIAIFFIVVTFYAEKLYEKALFTNLFVLFSSAYIPFLFFKSRAAGFALFVYIAFRLYKKKSYFKENIIRSIILFSISTILFLTTSHSLVDNIYQVKDTPEAVAQVFKHKYTVSNVYDEKAPLFYIYNQRLYSADGNLNWRLQLWQDIFNYSSENNKIVFGHGFHTKPVIFDNLIYSELDGLNENPHNFFINVFMRSGIVGLLLMFYFLFNLFINVKKKMFSNDEFLIFTLPLIFISMFDGSMENPYFGITFYFFLSSFYSGVTFKTKD